MRVYLLAFGGLGAAARGVGAGAAVGLDVCAGSFVLLHSAVSHLLQVYSTRMAPTDMSSGVVW